MREEKSASFPARRDVLAGVATASLVPALARAQTPDPIPFEYRGSKIFVGALVNGRRTFALIDTGARTAAISTDLAMHLGVRGRPVQVRGANRMSVAQLHTGLNVILGNVLMADVTAIGLDHSAISRVLGAPVGAVIGLDLFHRYVVGLDFETQVMTLTPRGEFSTLGRGLPVDLPHINNLMAIKVGLNDRLPSLAMLDLGSGDCLSLSPAFASQHRLLDGLKVSETVIHQADGSVVAKTATLKSVSLAGRTFENVPVTVTPTGAHDLILGMGILRRFHLTLDFTGQKSWLTPNGVIDARFRKDVLGLLLAPDRSVIHVPSGSPAEAAGVKAGDRIVGYGDMELARQIGGPAPPVGRELVVNFADGSTKTLVTAEYY